MEGQQACLHSIQTFVEFKRDICMEGQQACLHSTQTLAPNVRWLYSLAITSKERLQMSLKLAFWLLVCIHPSRLFLS